jgi:hypothetical protein
VIPDSQNRPIETQLRAAAARRRAAAGSPEMHPAMRETLLTEVRRQHGSQPKRPDVRRPWWVRLAPALTVVAVVAIGAWAVFRQEPNVTVELAKLEGGADRRQGDLAVAPAEQNESETLVEGLTRAQPTVEADALAPVASARFSASEPSLSLVPTRSAVSRYHSDELKLAQPVPPPATATGFAEARSLSDANVVTLKSQGEERELSLPPLTAESSPTLAAITPRAVPPPGSKSAGTGTLQQTTADSQTPVLQNFVVTQTGRRVRFIDADGSTYEGELQPLVARRDSPSVLGLAGRAKDAVAEARVAQESAAAPAPRTETVSYDFEAQGTNHTLQQQVRFAGNLVLTEQQLRLGRNSFSNTLPPELQQTQQRALQEPQTATLGRVQGMLQLGDGSSLRVDAVSTAPQE